MIQKELNTDHFEILLVEDNPADSNLVTEMLDSGGRLRHVVTVATRMEEAERVLEDRTFDLVLLDLRLPDASGLDAVKKVRMLAADVPLIVLTGIEDEFLALSCINGGAQDYLCKGEIKPLTLRRSIDHAVTRARDAQVRAHLSAQLQQAQKMEALGTLAGGIAHDFNNSLAVIIGNSELLLEDLPEASEVHDSAAEIRKAAVLAKELVGRILAFSRPHEPKRVPVKLADVVGEALKLIGPMVPKGIALETNVPSDLPEIAADPGQIHQVLVNLCTNAAHAIGDSPGRIRFEAETVVFGPGGGIPGSEVQLGRYVCLSVSDNGKGMDDATLLRAFEPFYTTKAVGKGSGLGLSIVHTIMKSHLGAVTVKSEPGKGTAFQLYFPIFSQGRRTEDAPVLEAVSGNGKHLMFVDDDEALVYLVPRRLRRMGFEVTAHTDVQRAIEDFRSRPQDFDAIISDFNMPSMSGPDLVRELRKIRPNIPTIVTSGFIRDEDASASRAAGADALIGKPSTIEEMANLIRSVLAKYAEGDPEDKA